MPHGYRLAVEGWHKPVTRPAKTDGQARAYLTLEVLNTGERIDLEPQQQTGRFSAFDLDRLARAMRDSRHGNEYPLDPELVDLVYGIQLHFKAAAVRVVSCYRTPHHGSRSNHGRGRAMDLIVPGASDEEVARYVRSRGFAGVGVYPNAGFVHVDVRPSSYYWIDNSGPGQRNCEHGTLAAEARSNDDLALAAGRRRPRPWAEPSANIDAVWKQPRPGRETDVETHEEPMEEDDLDPER